MNREIDNLGRIVIPKEMRKKLNIKKNDRLNIECKDNSIIFSKINNNDFISQLEGWINDWKDNLEDEKESVEGLDLFEQHTLKVLDDVLAKIIEIKAGDNNEVN